MSDIIRLSEVFRRTGMKTPNIPIVTDKIFKTSCPTCNETQKLIECKVYAKNGDTYYDCKNGCQVILIIGKPGDKPQPGRGYVLKNFVVRNISDLFIVSGVSPDVLLPKSPAALD